MNRKFNQARFVESLKKILDKKGWSNSDLVRHLIKNAPEGMKPNDTYVRGVLAGKVKPGVDYLGLFADLTGCSIDHFYDLDKNDKSGGLNAHA